MTYPKLLKNSSTVFLLKVVARARDVASAVLRKRWCRFIKPDDHSFPASLSSVQDFATAR